jgi:hypothetical protein
MMAVIFGRAGLDFSAASASSAATDLDPAFTVHPGESGLTAIRRLLDKLPDVVRVRGELAFLTELQAADPTGYSYGDDHAIIAGRYADEQTAPNRAQVYGDGVFGERFDWPAVAETGDRLAQTLDTNVSTAAEAEARAGALLRRAALSSLGGEITIRPNCGQELYDVIEVTDAAAGLAAAKRRVLGIELRYSASRGLYEHRLALGGV